MTGACLAGASIAAGRSVIDFQFQDAAFAAPRAAVCSWLARAVVAVVTYYGGFPVRALTLLMRPVASARLAGATTYGEPGEPPNHPLIEVRLGAGAAAAVLGDDWVLTHEMVHLSVPSVPRASHWLEEGIATYVEPIARVQSGELTARRIWSDMYRDMRKGLPGPGEAGLDDTPTWGRTYWGGALFCLMADVQIRQRTGNRKGLQDALRAVLAAGGSIETDWTTEQFMQAGDRAVGTPVLQGLYRALRASPAPGTADLEALWRDLGVSAGADGVDLSERAPLAAIRDGITARRAEADGCSAPG